ncbi:MAG TPA: hypothetical protein VFL42_05840 [Terriglobales bacterium]|nr:hypothetical protein [Terriglobales bacterium]
MADPVRRGSENPEFSAERALPRAEERVPARGEGIHVVETGPEFRGRAARGGAALGRAAAILRRVKNRLSPSGQEAAADKVRVLADRGRARAEELGEAAASRAQEWVYFMRERSLELKDRAQERWNYLCQERPLHVAIAAGGVGLLIGVGLRLRRAKNAER